MNQGSSFGGPSDQGQRQNSFGPVTAQNNIQPGSGGSYSVGLPAVSSGQFGPVGAGPQMVPNSASQSYSGGVPAQIPVQQFSPPSSSSSGSYGGGSPMQSGIQNSQPTGFQNSGQQASSAGFTVSPIAQSLAPLTGFTAAPVTPSAAFNQIQGSNQLASGFASSLPAALNPVGQNIGSSSGLNNGFSQTGNNPQSQNFNNQLGNNQQQTQSFYGGASGNAQLPVIQQQQQQSSFPFGQLPQQFINPVQQPIEPSGYGIGTPSVSPSFGQSGYGNSVSQPVPQPQPQPQFYGSSPQNSFNSPPGQGSAIQSYGSSFPQGEVYGGPGTAQLNPMVGHQQPSYGGMSSSPQSGYGQSGNNINRPNSSGAGNVPFGGSGGNQAGGYGLGNQGANQNFGGSSGGNGGAFGTGSNNAGQGGQNSVFAASIPNGQGLQGTTQSLFNNPNQPQGQSGFNQQNQQLGSNLQNQNLITTTPFSGFGGLASLAASIQQQLGGPTNPASSGSSNSIGATPSSAISPNQVQQQQTGQQNPQPGQVNNQQVNNQQLTNQLNSNPNQLNGGLSGNQLNQQGFPSTNSNQNQLNGGLSGNQGYQQGLLPVNGNPGNQQGSGLGGNQQNQQNINQLNQAPQNIGGNTGSQLYG
ncbi:hypothetical protein RvY_10600 [Ramazzottius varieornatus]|uniref:Uncharacterized protein n=1 Tax=Ramazzottius varieornatus TaxID=947166 RepID=A0A1D1VHS6_RAMVA|nr:hypothetical protein RvY_10600 [Ramazzottius varieornatus]